MKANLNKPMAAQKIDKAEFERLWKRGVKASDIAVRLGVRVDSVYKFAHRHRLPSRKTGKIPIITIDRELEWKLRKYYPDMGNKVLSLMLGLSPDYIGVLARQLGLKKSEYYWNGIKEYHRKRCKQSYQQRHKDNGLNPNTD